MARTASVVAPRHLMMTRTTEEEAQPSAGSAEYDIPVLSRSQLSALRHRATGEARRCVDDVHRPGLAGARSLAQFPGRARGGGRAAVPAGSAAHPLGWPTGRS